MTTSTIARPQILSREQWLTELDKLQADEEELTKHYDRVNANRLRLSMVKVEKNYLFDGPKGKVSLKDLFEGRRQLIVYHLMFDPAWEKGYSGCTTFLDALGDLSLLKQRDTTFVAASRAPLAKLEANKQQKEWSIAWFSSHDSDFNCDFHVTPDPKYRKKKETASAAGHSGNTENRQHGVRLFLRIEEDIFYKYAT